MKHCMIILIAVILGFLFAITAMADTVELASIEITTEVFEAAPDPVFAKGITIEMPGETICLARGTDIALVADYTQMTALEYLEGIAECDKVDTVIYAIGKATRDVQKIPRCFLSCANQVMGEVNDRTIFYHGRGRVLRA